MREGKLKKISSLSMRDVGSRIPSLPPAVTLKKEQKNEKKKIQENNKSKQNKNLNN